MVDIPYIFVYGSLRFGFELNHFLKNSRFVGLGLVEGYKMYDLGSYPGVVRGDSVVHGEVYEINDELLNVLDEVEDYRGSPDDLYIREKVRVYFDDKRKYYLDNVYIYVYNQDITGRDVIVDGDYSKYVGTSAIFNYFAYAENTNDEILKARGVTKIFKKIPVYLPDYKIVFNVECKWGYCANLTKYENGRVCGYLLMILEDELNLLDSAEKHLVRYIREVFKVYDNNGKEYYACAYVAPNISGEHNPTDEYKRYILEGLKGHCISSGL
ncbi:hypothetical protein SacN8_11355 [Sulfolobus acidocaldarius N8]|uniref:Gamma-glutamylcyclotransferase AIG2-like domain-containing protein n=2 Tax=Sulfolobus acidocaldarius TaxID=2285 RepID=M1J1T7_9CREN|nr:gamma-glutamylcyclotransferase [Sulfolobus acidocaldarius]AGE72215.1 hypothetical protein SacN8_11355 [Sulfolobus acidocaldarius N8]AGE74532.1 hypothetical protein SacRon12I_11600 [Sulfolobus acidocaldarius Ron12/I]WCM35963.1 gamma-glutamylcyclotransferase [Sulfolobus acidocaldarius DSM 639]